MEPADEGEDDPIEERPEATENDPDRENHSHAREEDRPEDHEEHLAEYDRAAIRLRELVAYLEAEAEESGLPREGPGRELLLEARSLREEIRRELGTEAGEAVESDSAEPIDIPVRDVADVHGHDESRDVGGASEKTDEPSPDESPPDEPSPDEPSPDEPSPDESPPDEPSPDEPSPDESPPDESPPDVAESGDPEVDVQAELDAIDIEAELAQIKAEIRTDRDPERLERPDLPENEDEANQ